MRISPTVSILRAYGNALARLSGIKLTQVRENLYGRSRLLTREAEAVVPLATLSCAV